MAGCLGQAQRLDSRGRERERSETIHLFPVMISDGRAAADLRQFAAAAESGVLRARLV